MDDSFKVVDAHLSVVDEYKQRMTVLEAENALYKTLYAARDVRPTDFSVVLEKSLPLTEALVVQARQGGLPRTAEMLKQMRDAMEEAERSAYVSRMGMVRAVRDALAVVRLAKERDTPTTVIGGWDAYEQQLVEWLAAHGLTDTHTQKEPTL